MSGWIRICRQTPNEVIILGDFGAGTIIGEEWLYQKGYESRMFKAMCPGSEVLKVGGHERSIDISSI